MSTRKKATKKPTSRTAKVSKRATKSSASRKSKDVKVSAKASKSVRAPKKIAAKAAKSTKVSSRAVAAAKAKALRAKSARAGASAKSAAKAASKKKATPIAKSRVQARASGAAKPAGVRSKDRKIVSAAKKKSDSVKKGQERLSAKTQPKIVESKTPAVEGSQANLPKAAPVARPAAPVVALEVAAAAKPVKAAAPEKAPAPAPAPAPAVEETVAPKVAKPVAPRQGFKTNEFVVYPAHGVGQIVAIEEQVVAGFRLELFVITFVKDKMTLRVPTGKVAGVGMRKLAEPEVVKKSLDVLLGRARIKRTMWSRRAQEYETKINSGDLTAIAEVVRDLYRSEAQPEQSYSERQLYEAALDRMAREVAVVQKLSESEALKAIDAQLQKNQRRGAKSETEAAGPGPVDTDVEEAA